jgi:uncharacterized protein YerC
MMTNVSHNKTKGEDYLVAYRQLVKVISLLNKQNAEYLIEDLFTESERVMLVKRFAAVFMFERGHSPYRVSRTISLSDSTTQRLFKQYRGSKFDRLLSCMTKKQQSEFLSLLTDLMLSKASLRARKNLIRRITR